MDEESLSGLVLAAQKGEKAAFGQIYQLFLKRIYRFVFLKVGNCALAEDLTQTTFLKAWQALPAFSPEKGMLQAFLFKVARNLTVDEFRKKKREVSLEVVSEPESTENLEASVFSLIEAAALKKFLKSLKAEDRELINLFYLEEMPAAEVAAVLGKHEGAVRVKIHRLLKTLRQSFGEEYES